LNILSRINTAEKNLDKLSEELGAVAEPTAEQFADFDKKIREQLNFVLGSDVCTAAFGNVNCLSPVDGKMLFERFTESFLPILKEDIAAAAEGAKAITEARTAKYIDPVVEPSADNAIDISSLTTEQKNAILKELLK
jgi:hypothetical protein